jgi:hypothetical protein
LLVGGYAGVEDGPLGAVYVSCSHGLAVFLEEVYWTYP